MGLVQRESIKYYNNQAMVHIKFVKMYKLAVDNLNVVNYNFVVNK